MATFERCLSAYKVDYRTWISQHSRPYEMAYPQVENTVLFNEANEIYVEKYDPDEGALGDQPTGRISIGMYACLIKEFI